MDLEKNIKEYENSPSSSITQDVYIAKKLEFEALMDEKTNGYILRSKTQWYQDGEKSSQFFLNLEKKRGVQNTISVLCNEGEDGTPESPIKNQQKISKCIKKFYSNLFKRTSSKTFDSCKQFLQNINLPCITQTQKDFLNRPLTLRELELSIKNSQNGKSPGMTDLQENFILFFGETFLIYYFKASCTEKRKVFYPPHKDKQ